MVAFMKVLLVDDDMDVLYAMTRFLQDFGLDVTRARGGEEGLSAFQHHGPFDAVLTDFSMWDMDGVQLSQAILKISPEQKILINTGCNDLASTMGEFGLAHIPVINKRLGPEAIYRKLISL